MRVLTPRRRSASPRTLGRAFWSDDRGQDLVEFVLTLPLLLIMAFGILELGSLLDIGLSISGLSREGANIASRGASLDSVVQVTVANGSSWNLASAGTVIASQITVQGGVPTVTDQRSGGGLGATSRVGVDGTATIAYQGGGLIDGQIYYVVEIFLPYQPFTPLSRLVGSMVPDTLYDRTLF
jgi:Flp pilus assembly protein TadG